MSAAEHLQEAIAEGCTRDDHDHVGDHRAEVLAEVDARLGAMTFPDHLQHTLNAGTYQHAWRDCRAIVKEMAAGQAGKGTHPGECEQLGGLVALAIVLEIPRPGTAPPIQLRLSHGHADRWAICDRTGRRWYPEGWMYEPADDRMCDEGRFTLAEAVPLARQLAETPACGRCHRPFDAADTRWNGAARHGDTKFCRACVDICHGSEDPFHRCPICTTPAESGEPRG